MKKLFCEFLEHLWCFLDAFWRFLVGPGRLLLVFDGFGESLVLLFTNANGSRQALFTGANGSRLGVMSLPPPAGLIGIIISWVLPPAAGS